MPISMGKMVVFAIATAHLEYDDWKSYVVVEMAESYDTYNRDNYIKLATVPINFLCVDPRDIVEEVSASLDKRVKKAKSELFLAEEQADRVKNKLLGLEYIPADTVKSDLPIDDGEFSEFI